MDMTYLIGRGFESKTKGYKDSEGVWHVNVLMTETVSYPNGTEREEFVESEAQDVSFHEAHKNAMRDVLQLLQDLVYSKGFDSLIEAMDYERSLQEPDDSKAETDEAPTPE